MKKNTTVSEQLKIFTCKIVESVLRKIDTPITHDRSFSWLGVGTSIKRSGGDKLA